MNTSQANPAMPNGNQCPQCGAPLPAGALAGLCPACLLKQGAAADTAPPPGAAPFTPPSVAELAKLFPQLEILGLIGQGGMGAVYKARQPALDRFVALKILPPQAAPGVNFAERFNREARALAKLSHPNIVAVYDFGQAGALHYFIMEFVDGANLRQLIRSGRLAPREALAVVPQICDALQFAHDEGVVHRDIKPENILVDRRGRVKITDFGLAKILGIEADASRLTREGQVMGTPHYMAPEQVEHPQTVDHRADIYSLGVVFYEMLTGELPLGKFPVPSQKVQVDVRLDEVVLHALEKEPERRYQQASEVKTAVETIATTPAAQPDIETARIARDSIWFGASTLPDLLPGERIIHFKKRLWAVFNKSLPLVYRLFFSLPPFWSAGLYVTDRRLLFASHFFGVLNQQFSIWFSDKAPDARRERFASADSGKSRWFGDFLEVKSKSPQRRWWRSTDLTLRLYMRQPAMVREKIAAAKTCVVSAVAVSAQAATALPKAGQPWQSPTSGWGHFIGYLFGITFTSPLAFKLANLSALGFLCFLGFMPLPGWQCCFGFSGLFGLIGVAFLIEMAARSRGGRLAVGAPASGKLAQHAANPLPVLQFWEALEDGDYARAWEKTSAYFQRDLSKDGWAARMERIRRPLGKAVRREQLPFCWLNVGTRQETRCKTTFDSGKKAMETAVAALQPNGEWRIESYRLDLTEASPATLPPSDTVLRQVNGPAIGLIATAILNWVAIPAIVMAMVFVGASPNSLIGDGLLVAPIAAFVLCTVMLIGALKMKRLESPTWAVTASMLAMFISPGNIIGLPLGIWAMVVLVRPQVHAAFRRQPQQQEPTPHDTLLGRLALGLFIGGLLGTILIMAVSPWQAMALIFGGLALVLALVFGVMGRRERLGRLAVFCALVTLVGLPASLFSAFWTEQACSIVTLVPRVKEEERAHIARAEAVRARAARASTPVIESVVDGGRGKLIEGRGVPGAKFILQVGKGSLSCSFLNDSPFTAAIERALFGGGLNCLVKDSLGNVRLTVGDSRIGPMIEHRRGRIAFRVGTLRPEPDGSYVLGEFRPETGAPLPVTVRLETLSKQTAAPAEPPQLRFLAWQAEGPHVTNTIQGLPWYPDGKPMTNHGERMTLPTPTRVDVRATTEWEKNPRFLYFWFSHPALDNNSFQRVTLLDGGGQPLPAAAGGSSASSQCISDSLGWIMRTLCPGYAGQIPPTINIRLEYSLGPWKTWSEIASDYKGGLALGNGVMLGTIGQNAAGHAFVSITRSDFEKPATQYGFLALTREGRALENTGGGSSGFTNLLTETFEFPVKLDEVKGFLRRTRPIQGVEFKNVPLATNEVQTAANGGGSKPPLLDAEMTQEVVKDLLPDGTIRFKTTISFRHTTGTPLTTLRFSNSDFVRVDKLSDAQGRPLPFTVKRAGRITQSYEATLIEPVAPGSESSYVMEGTETGLVKPLAQPGEFEYTMRHWPGSSRTRRIERHLLPAGARLLSRTPADLAERTRDGRIELFIDRLIPGGDSLEISYRWAKQGD